MKKIIRDIKKVGKDDILIFPEDFFLSSDEKSVLGEITFKEILFLDYRETEAGSNPREYNGLKSSNKKILISLLNDHKNLFRFLHSGLIVSLINPIFKNNKVIQYDDCCLTNGNQTRFLILILTLLRLFFENNSLSKIDGKTFNDFIVKEFADSDKLYSVLNFVKFKRVNEITNYILNDPRLNKSFDGLDIENFLNCKIRIQINLLTEILEDLKNKNDEFWLGTQIAEANNETQKVQYGDIFGNKYKNELKEYIFKDFQEIYKDKVLIEYRAGEVAEKKNKVHILTLLRPIISTGILTQDKYIFDYTNKREPVYKLTEKLLKKNKLKKVTSIISKLVPLFYRIREEHVIPILESHYRKLTREYLKKATHGDLDHTSIAEEIKKLLNEKKKLENLIKRNIKYNVDHILPVLIYQIRNIILIENGKARLNTPINEEADFLKTLIEVIYEEYVELKLGGLPTSLTTVVRKREFYEMGSTVYKTLIRTKKIEETDFVYSHRVNI